jgi:hypothetical protein
VLSAAILLAPIQYTLLVDASGQDQADQIGVILIMLQWALLVIAFSIARGRAL